MAGAPTQAEAYQMMESEVNGMTDEQLHEALNASRRNLLEGKTFLERSDKDAVEAHFDNTSMGKLCQTDYKTWTLEQREGARQCVLDTMKMADRLERASEQKFGSSVNFHSSEGSITATGPEHNEITGKSLDNKLPGFLGAGVKLGAALAVIFGLGRTMGDHGDSVKKAIRQYNAKLKAEDPNSEQYSAKWVGGGLKLDGVPPCLKWKAGFMEIRDSKGNLASADVTASIAQGAKIISKTEMGYKSTVSHSNGPAPSTKIKASAQQSTAPANAVQPSAPVVDNTLTVRTTGSEPQGPSAPQQEPTT